MGSSASMASITWNSKKTGGLETCEAIALRLEAIANRWEAIAALRLEAIASRCEAIALRLEAIANRWEAIANRWEAIAALRLEAIAIRREVRQKKKKTHKNTCLDWLSTGHCSCRPSRCSTDPSPAAVVSSPAGALFAVTGDRRRSGVSHATDMPPTSMSSEMKA